MINNKLLDNVVSMVNILKVGVNDYIFLCFKKILDFYEGKIEKRLKKKEIERLILLNEFDCSYEIDCYFMFFYCYIFYIFIKRYMY